MDDVMICGRSSLLLLVIVVASKSSDDNDDEDSSVHQNVNHYVKRLI